MIAICVGHSRLGDKGSVSVGGISEWHFNYPMAVWVRNKLQDLGHEAVVISKYPRSSYSGAMDWLGAELRRHKATAAVELHFNSDDSPSAHGHEWLHWKTSVPGRALAKCLQSQMQNTFPQNKSRGLVPVKSAKERGGLFMLRTPCPAVICEPFFGSNPDEWGGVSEQREMLAEVIALGIDDWKGGAR